MYALHARSVSVGISSTALGKRNIVESGSIMTSRNPGQQRFGTSRNILLPMLDCPLPRIQPWRTFALTSKKSFLMKRSPKLPGVLLLWTCGNTTLNGFLSCNLTTPVVFFCKHQNTFFLGYLTWHRTVVCLVSHPMFFPCGSSMQIGLQGNTFLTLPLCGKSSNALFSSTDRLWVVRYSVIFT